MALSQQLPALTGLRAYAALWVVAFHLAATLKFFAPVPVVLFAARGYLGVDIFFVLSGFVLSHRYGDEIRDRRSYLRFLGRRLARIYPLHLTTLATIVIAAAAIGPDRFGPYARFLPFDEHIAYHVLLVNAWGVTDLHTWNTPSWTVSAEWLAYLCFPVFLTVAAAARRPRTAALGAAVSLAAVVLALQLLGEPRLHVPNVRGVPRLFGEVLAGCFAHRIAALIRAPIPPWVSNIAIAATIFVALSPLADPLIPFACVPLLVVLARGGGRLSGLLDNSGAVWLGTISYSIYLLHLPLWWLRRFAGPRWYHPTDTVDGTLLVLAFLAVVILAAWAAYRLVERPARRAIGRAVDRQLGQS